MIPLWNFNSKALTLEFDSTALRKGPWRFWPHCYDYDCHRALPLTCWNSLQWQGCEWGNDFYLLSGHHCSLDSNSMVITWHMH